MQYRSLQLTALFALFLSISPLPQKLISMPNNMGIGIIVGEPTGFSFKYKNFPILGLAWSIENHLHFHADYWLLNPSLKGPVKWFLGAGGKMTLLKQNENEGKRNDDKNDSEFSLGIRIPAGIQYYIAPSLELFFEVAPGISVIPETDFDIDGGFGLRYYWQ